MRRRSVVRVKATGRQILALHELLESLELEERRELRLRLRAAYVANPEEFIRRLPDHHADVESVKRWRQSS